MSLYFYFHKMVFLKYCIVQISNGLSWLNFFYSFHNCVFDLKTRVEN